MSNIFTKRINNIKRTLKKENKAAALLLSSAPSKTRSRDTSYPYRQNSDFYYLTGSKEKDLTILISTKEKTPILFAKKTTEHQVLWDGKPKSAKLIAKQFGAKLVYCKSFKKEIKAYLKDLDCLYYQNTPGSLSWEITQECMNAPSHARNSFPKEFLHSDALLEHMRLIKSKEEIDAICTAAKISNYALMQTLDIICSGNLEYQIAAALEFYIKFQGAELAFPSVVASGPSAATLHYQKHSRRLKNGELLLIDFGAEHDLYSADITRCIPVSNSFSPLQSDLYNTVLEAQEAALAKLKHGVYIETVHAAAAKVMTEGLVELGVLKGKVSSLVNKQAYKKYFPHGIGHSLGLDTHDIGNLRADQKGRLEQGMVLTIEPGIYFQKKTGHIPPCGIRIEDDVLITKDGCRILSEGFPKEIEEIEML